MTEKAKLVYYSPMTNCFERLVPDAQTEAAIWAEAEEWVIRDECDWQDDDDDYGVTRKGHKISYVPVTKMTSRTSTEYSTSDIIGDILTDGHHFIGVVLRVTESGGSFWRSYRHQNTAVLYTDGKVDGKPVKSYCFSGESSGSDSTDTYSLVKKDKK